MRKIIFSAIALFVSLSLNAQILYKISGNGAKGESYVMGTHHLAPISILDSIAGFDVAISSVDAVYGEIEQSEMNSPTSVQKMMSMATAPADSTLSKVFSKEQYDSIDIVIKKYSKGMVSLNALEAMKPAMVSQQLTLFMSMQVIPGFNPMQQLDSYVQQIGSQKGKSIYGFETVDFQLDILMGDYIAKQAEDLLEAVRNEDKLNTTSIELYHAYMNQDIDKVLELMLCPDSGMDSEAEKILLTDRNENWASQLQQIMPHKSVFVCVGAGHLPGEKGLLNLLRQAGYTITPIY